MLKDKFGRNCYCEKQNLSICGSFKTKGEIEKCVSCYHKLSCHSFPLEGWFEYHNTLIRNGKVKNRFIITKEGFKKVTDYG